MATKPMGGGAKDLSGRATKKITFFGGFPRNVHERTASAFSRILFVHIAYIHNNVCTFY